MSSNEKLVTIILNSGEQGIALQQVNEAMRNITEEAKEIVIGANTTRRSIGKLRR